MTGDVDEVLQYAIDMVLRAPHLYMLTVLYWMLIGAVVITRYLLKRESASEWLMRAILALGTVALVLAFVDVALRGRELIQISLVAYFATPLGIGRYIIRKWDGRAVTGWRGVATREVTYVIAFFSFVALSVVDGDPWWFTRPEIDRSDAIASIENTNWLHLMATVLGITAVLEAVSSLFNSSKAQAARRPN